MNVFIYFLFPLRNWDIPIENLFYSVPFVSVGEKRTKIGNWAKRSIFRFPYEHWASLQPFNAEYNRNAILSDFLSLWMMRRVPNQISNDDCKCLFIKFKLNGRNGEKKGLQKSFFCVELVVAEMQHGSVGGRMCCFIEVEAQKKRRNRGHVVAFIQLLPRVRAPNFHYFGTHASAQNTHTMAAAAAGKRHLECNVSVETFAKAHRICVSNFGWVR